MSLPLTPEDEDGFRRAFRRPRKAHASVLYVSDRGVGRFRIGQRVRWCASARCKPRTGVIVEVVATRQLPTVARDEAAILKIRKLRKSDITWPEMNRVGQWREWESYVVEDASGRRWWPRVGNLELIDD